MPSTIRVPDRISDGDFTDAPKPAAGATDAGKAYAWNHTTQKFVLTAFLSLAGNIDIPAGSEYRYAGIPIMITQPFSNNYFFGEAGNRTMTGVNNTAVGFGALGVNVTSIDNVAIGSEAMKSVTAGVGGVAIGRLALEQATNSNNNVAVGDSALRFNIGISNVGVGYRVAEGHSTGDRNVFIGGGARVLATSGTENVVVGNAAMSGSATGGNENTAIGYSALLAYAGSGATAVGHSALIVATGIRNTAVGASGGGSITTGIFNVFMGWSAGTDPAQKVDATNSIGIGYRAYTTADNQVVLGNSDITTTVLRGKVGIGTMTPGTDLDVNGIMTYRNVSLFGEGGAHGFLSWNGGLVNTLNLIGASGKGLSLGSNAVYDRLYLDTSGNVGIGLTTPNSKLDVAGTVQADGLRLDVTPTAEVRTATHTITFSANGTNYKLLCVAA